MLGIAAPIIGTTVRDISKSRDPLSVRARNSVRIPYANRLLPGENHQQSVGVDSQVGVVAIIVNCRKSLLCFKRFYHYPSHIIDFD